LGHVSAITWAEKTLMSDSSINEFLIINLIAIGLATVRTKGILISGLYKCVAFMCHS